MGPLLLDGPYDQQPHLGESVVPLLRVVQFEQRESVLQDT